MQYSDTKGKDTKGKSYIFRLFVIVGIIALGCAAIYSVFCLYMDNKRLHTELDSIYGELESTVEAWNPSEKDSENTYRFYITAPEKPADSEPPVDLQQALSIMQSQYDTNMSNQAMILTIFFAGVSLFSLALPIFNYVFFQKEQIAQIDNSLISSKKSVDDALDKIKSEFAAQTERQKKAIEQCLDVSFALVDENWVIHIEPLSDSASDQAAALYINGSLYYYKKKYSNAIDFLTRAISYDSSVAKYHNDLGAAFHMLGRYEEDLLETKKAVELEPDNAEYYNNLGTTLHQMERYEESLIETQKAIDLEPRKAGFHESLSITLHIMGRYEEALIKTKKAIELEPFNAAYYESLAITLQAMGKLDEAQDAREKAAELEPENRDYQKK